MRPEVRVVSNMDALRVEEVGMMASTDAQLLAPEELKKRQKGDLKVTCLLYILFLTSILLSIGLSIFLFHCNPSL